MDLSQENQLNYDTLAISGMHCAACHQIIEFRLMKLSGIHSITINTATHRANISWDPQKTTLSRIIETITSLGYGALPIDAKGNVENREHKKSIWRLFVAGFAMMQVMMYALPAYIDPIPQIDGDLTPDIDRLLKLASLTLAIPVVIFSAQPFFQSAVRDLRNRHIGMDIPVSIGIIVTFIASIWSTFNGGPVYYDSLIMFVFLLLSARMIQENVHNKSSAALRRLTTLLPLMAEKIRSYPDDMQTNRIPASQIRSGDFILIEPGATIPADGKVISGISECDESVMTGESRAVSKNAGDQLIGGSINLNRPLIMQATNVGNDTQLSTLVRMMESAASEKPPLVQIADRYASHFLSIILVLSVISGLIWWLLDPSRAIWIAVTVLVITCPCALSLATPGVMSATIGQLAKHGMLIARGRAVESLAKATHFVFDKTGTLTQGNLKLIKKSIIRLPEGFDLKMLDSLISGITATSNHPVSRSLFEAHPQKQPSETSLAFEHFNEIPGGGIEAQINNIAYRLGNANFIWQFTGTIPQIPEDYQLRTHAVLADHNGIIAIFALEDSLRIDARLLVNSLKKQGKEILLLSGDQADVALRVADELGIRSAKGNLTPEDKFNIVKELQKTGATVAMIGDGINDGPVLSIANVSIAMGQGAPISQARSDLVLISNDMRDLDYAVKMTTAALKLIHQNLGWAIIYNLVAIPAAVMGALLPWHAAIGMSLSSVIVVVNSLRILRISRTIAPEKYLAPGTGTTYCPVS
jgi:P-type Cu2+ transporter